MKKSTFDYAGAKEAGYNDDEISQYLAESNHNFDYQGAIESGYTPQEINEHLSSYKPKKSKLEQGARIAGQFAIGAAENALLPYELATMPLASKEAQNAAYREEVGADIERIQEQKAMGQWDEQDKELYDSLVKQINDPQESQKYVKTADIGVRGLAEKSTGLDLHPEGTLEKAAAWRGFLTNPKSVKEIAKAGISPSKLASFFGGSKTLRSLGAGFGLEMAEEGDLGPIGTMGAAILGDLAGGGVSAGLKGAGKLVTSPKKTIAKAVAKLTPKEKLGIQKELIESLRENNIQANLGTISNSKLIQGIEAKLSQSSLSGEAPEKLREAMSRQIKDEYKRVADSLGESRFQTLHEAGEVGKEAVTRARDFDKQIHSELYEKARARLNEGSTVNSSGIVRSINKIEKDLSMGALKSPEQKKVLEALDTLKQDVYDTSGKVKHAKVQDLMSSKVALQDIIDYEVQGGQKQLLKGVVKELDDAILSYGKQDAQFLKYQYNANKKFAEHAKTFRNEGINRILFSKDPMTVMNKMNTVQGVRDMRTALYKFPGGKETFNDLARAKFDQVVGSKMGDNISEQVKTGKFANLLQNPKNAQLVKELLPPESYKILQSLMKNSGKLTEAAQKFFNASKSASTLLDTALVGNALLKIGAFASGNPWPFAKAAGIYLTARSMSKLMYDPKFLRMVEDVILASEKHDLTSMLNIGMGIESAIKEALGPAVVQDSNQ